MSKKRLRKRRNAWGDSARRELLGQLMIGEKWDHERGLLCHNSTLSGTENAKRRGCVKTG